ncbi:hypothetical protein MTZ49_09620 [Entomomonas sp. E2T0]|uniref:hypothetical protein n=1 Tax=Entomomonas sp. E2T0 TaxID=2930213 RepID=UPI0022284C48|nr:hypothetical protein [Entomomonas sp. E2T0]UYZ82870.1 hypothetical protein MTZ49_09620 [Entomomonas sp. E2T0]
MVRYSTLSLTSRERIFLHSILVMYNTRGNASWTQDDTQYDILIIGKEATKEQVLAIPEHVEVALSFNIDIQRKNCKIFYIASPIKATELIDKISQAESALKGLDNGDYKAQEMPSNRVVLLQWPRAEVLATNNVYPILSALLSKRAMTLQELADISRKPEDICYSFIAQVLDSGDAAYLAEDAMQKLEQPKTSDAPKRGFLDRIRAGLGLLK